MRDTVSRRLAHVPFGHRPTTLLVRVRRYRCDHCRRTWRQHTSIYQCIVAAYREPDKTKGKQMMQAVIDAATAGVPAALTEIRRLGRTLKRRTTPSGARANSTPVH